jgi:hypothetical protein
VLPAAAETDTVTIPVTVDPLAGWVIETVGVVPGDVVPLFETVTERVAVPVRPAESFTVAVSVCVPLAAAVVFQAKLGPLPLTVPASAVSV